MQALWCSMDHARVKPFSPLKEFLRLQLIKKIGLVLKVGLVLDILLTWRLVEEALLMAKDLMLGPIMIVKLTHIVSNFLLRLIFHLLYIPKFSIIDRVDTTFENIQITAPPTSPNTDGIHIGSSTGIKIFSSSIATGDDCVSIGPGTDNLLVSGLACGPGHGISIGSLGRYPNEADVTNLVIQNCNISGTSNGVRIKTWAPSPPSNVYNVTFENIGMNNVDNPIIIDQQYCPFETRKCGNGASSQVQIRNVKFNNIYGTSKNKVAVELKCSPSKPCGELSLTNINLNFPGGATSSCSNAYGTATGREQPPACI
ncbi:hypothetical protein F8388_025188 [Cannabis sativa]|uniref:Polygalacturonase n=1 Tax=Cannabis sativa TaxID=3483 RepID=A0A7J6FRY5_CANSA|nr:hypothetical protein F8388_025188 [Cannabis sativa]